MKILKIVCFGSENVSKLKKNRFDLLELPWHDPFLTLFDPCFGSRPILSEPLD